MDLVDEEDVAILKIGQEGSKIPRLCDDWARRCPDPDTHLTRQDPGEGRLAQTRGPVEEHMVERLAAAFCSGHKDPKVFSGRLLANELIKALGAKRYISVFACSFRRRDAGGIAGHLLR